jgi:hypothetical protein
MKAIYANNSAKVRDDLFGTVNSKVTKEALSHPPVGCGPRLTV